MAENQMPIQNEAQDQQDYNELVAIRREKLKALQDAGKDPFANTVWPQSDFAAEIKESFVDLPEDAEPRRVCMAGRMMSKRVMGKASFADLRDKSGNIQMYVRRDDIGTDSYQEFKKFDIGDIVGVRGFVFRTKMGEISVHVTEIVLLSKSLLPLPEKFHGLTDRETRYRQRYVDLIVNPEVKDVFIKRSKIIKEIRNYLDDHAFMEVETPVLHTQAGGAAARPFITHHNTLDIDMYMRIALELHLKRLVVGGLDRVYEIGRVFRNEGMDTRHNPEFTMLEAYQAYTDYRGMMDLCEDMMRTVARKVNGTAVCELDGVTYDLEKPFTRISMVEAVRQHAGVDFDAIADDEAAKAVAKEHHVAFEPHHKKGDILNLFFEEFVEEKLVQPTFLTGHPVEISPLSKKDQSNPAYTERFELFIGGREYCNAFSELNDPIDQRQRFEYQEFLKAHGDDEASGVDEDFLNALSYGLPPTGGIGIGVDRFVMLLTGASTIRDVLLFPTMKPLDAVKKESAADGEAQQAPKTEEKPAEKIDFSNVKIEPLFEEYVDFETFSKSDFRAVKVKACEAVPKSKKLLKFVLDDGTSTDRVILSGIHEYYEPEELVGKTCIAITNLPPRPMMGIDSCGMLISAVHEENGKEGLNLLMVDSRIPAGAKLY
ncbi:MAG TPA: lysine--tRNA ligase [Candidatus Ruthenibacterium merdavium]|uniref:Lysine--tRNA ligase n=1 Tax=Candidatus Ruthenibacterium merdavium TaxID=2838752 RepID=A0A9D2TIJ7_9FIRM|nr:lysine--tRNA ligase [Candidatus Ruthenibacterium merdavium]